MKSIDFKSLLIGILGTALVMVLMGQSSLKREYDIECVTNADSSYIQCKRFRLNGRGFSWITLRSSLIRLNQRMDSSQRSIRVEVALPKL